MSSFREPVRKVVRRSGFGNRGYFPSYKMDMTIEFESQRERRCAWLLEYSSAVVRYVHQPLKLQYADDEGQTRQTIPDFGAELRDGSGMLVEVKARDTLLDPSVRARLEPIRKAANRDGNHYVVVTDDVLFESVATKNVEELLFFRPPLYERARFITMLQTINLDGLTLKRAAALIGREEVMKILALQLIYTQLRVPITDDAVLMRRHGGANELLLS